MIIIKYVGGHVRPHSRPLSKVFVIYVHDMWQVLLFTYLLHFIEHFVNLLHVESYAQHGRIRINKQFSGVIWDINLSVFCTCFFILVNEIM